MGEARETVVFGGGCFWCTEAVFLRLKGVFSVTSGYAGGFDKLTPSGDPNPPTYEEVSTGKTGHAEVIQIEYDPAVVPFMKLLEVFFSSHDPTTLNRQGADVGSQYRSIILYTTERQREEAREAITALAAAKKFTNPIVTEVSPLERFWPAEEYHRDFYARNPSQPYAEAVITPKVEKLEREHARLLKE